jgi:SPP1 gp7 family putative phage head morphogenesis protein
MVNPFKLFKTTTKEQSTEPKPIMLRNAALSNEAIMTSLMGSFDTYNPDQLVEKKGAAIYDKMLRDAQVRSAFSVRVNVIISRNWFFRSTKDGQEEIIKFFERNITDIIDGTWLGAMRAILMGKAYGYSMSEKVYEAREVDNKPRWVLKAINPKPWYSFKFITDPFGNIKKVIQTGVNEEEKTIPLEKFIRYVNRPEMDPIWGESDFRAIYRPYWEKDITQKFWNIYMERMAGGFLILTPGPDAKALSPTEEINLQNALSNVNGTTSFKPPKGYTVELVQGSDTEAFMERVVHLDRQISKGLLQPNLLGFAEQGETGSYAQASVQEDMFMMTIAEDGDYLADILNEQVFAELAWWNFGETDFPRFTFEPFTIEQKRKMAVAWNKAVKDGSVTNFPEDENHTRSLLQYSEVEVEDIEKAKVLPEPTVPEDEDPDKKKPEEKPTEPKQKDVAPDEPGEVVKSSEEIVFTRDELIKLNKKIEVFIQANGQEAFLKAASIFSHCNKDNKDLETILEEVEASEKERLKKDFREQQNFISRINIEQVEKTFDRLEDDWENDLRKSTDEIYKELSTTIKDNLEKFQRQKNNGSIDYEKVTKSFINSVSAKTKKTIRQSSLKYLEEGYRSGRKFAQIAIKNSVKTAPKDVKQKVNGTASLAPFSAIKGDWCIASFVEGITTDTAESWFSDRSFTITGDITQDMIDAAVISMKNGIVGDWSVAETVKELQKILPGYLGTPSKDGTVSPKANRARLNTIVRTNLSTIYNQAQMAVYTDPSLGDFVEAFQYIAVLDRRTTPICDKLDGEIYPKQDPIWQSITPPNHFQCRSSLIPVTVLDEWKTGSKKFTNAQQPSKGFGQSSFEQLEEVKIAPPTKSE